MLKPRIFAGALVALSWATGASALPAFETEAKLGVVSDYRWRGVSLSDEEPSLQAEITASHESGAWLWGGVNTVSQDLGGSEWSVAIGYDRTIAGFDWSVGAVQYFYPGEEEIDYAEFDISTTRAFGDISISAGVEYAPEQNNYDEDDTYLFVGFEAAAPHDLTFHGHAGRDDGIMALEAYAVDYSLGASRAFGAVTVDLTFVEAEGADSAFVFGLFFTP